MNHIRGNNRNQIRMVSLGQMVEPELDQEFDETIKDKLEHNHYKKENYQDIQTHLKETGDGQISITDPDSKAVVFQRNSVRVDYIVQAVNDTKALAIMVDKAQENIGNVENVLADKGYHSGRELKACEKLNVTTFVSPKESSSTKKNPDFAMESFKYDEKEDTLYLSCRCDPTYQWKILQ